MFDLVSSAALYACGIGPNKVPSTVEPAKQVFAFIPVRAEAKVDVSEGVKEVAKSQLKVAAAVLEDAGIDKLLPVKAPEADAAPAEPKESPKPKAPKVESKPQEPKPSPSPKAEEKPAPVPEEKAYSVPAQPSPAPVPATKKCLRRRSFDLKKRAQVAHNQYLDARATRNRAARDAATAARDASLAKRQVAYVPDGSCLSMSLHYALTSFSEYFILGRDHLME